SASSSITSSGTAAKPSTDALCGAQHLSSSTSDTKLRGVPRSTSSSASEMEDYSSHERVCRTLPPGLTVRDTIRLLHNFQWCGFH
ncbi:unnamed protein product, partial [Amoebophrya sp. A25]